MDQEFITTENNTMREYVYSGKAASDIDYVMNYSNYILQSEAAGSYSDVQPIYMLEGPDGKGGGLNESIQTAWCISSSCKNPEAAMRVEQKDYDRLEVLIKSTAGYYKTALNSGNKDIMLIENQKQLEYYVGIQKIRFGDCFTYETRLDDEVQYCSIPNLLLQPLVENAIVHGLKKQENCKDHILMSAKAVDNQLVLTVCDDGVGIAPEELEDIRREMEHYEGDGSKYFALVNVTARLHNRYKERASINIDSVVNEGTTVVIRIPMEEVS